MEGRAACQVVKMFHIVVADVERVEVDQGLEPTDLPDAVLLSEPGQSGSRGGSLNLFP